MKSVDKKTNGFTIVELMVVIVVIGILAGIVVVAYGSWHKNTDTNAVKSDLVNASTAMEGARNFSNGYPSSVPSTFQASENVQVTGGSSDGKSYCIQGVSSHDSTVSYYIVNGSKTPQVGSCEIVNDLIAQWPFNGNANDISGNGINATVNGASLTTGQDGGANGAYAIGNSAWIDVGSPASFANLAATGFTYSIWVQLVSVSTSQWPPIMGSTGSTHTYYGLRTNSYGAAIYFEYGTAPYSGSTYSSVSSAPLAVGDWHLATLTYGDSTLSFYLDGVLKGSKGATLNPTYGGLRFGAPSGGWIGNIDDARVYDKALAASDVQALYNAGAQ